jgi:hypothetical protein
MLKGTCGKLSLILALALALQAPVSTLASEGNPVWKPEASERLVKLPAQYLKKRLDNDFAESELGLALSKSEEDIALKTGTLQDLKSAIAEAGGEVKTELRHQFLAEKREYVRLMSEKNKLRRKALKTRLKLYERVLDRMTEEDAAATPARRDLIERQDGARARFESSVAKVDMKVFQSAAVPESKYSVKYAENMAAIEKLVARIQNHRMNASAAADGQPKTKAEHVRQMVADTQAGLAILDQEETILGYMAKLVAFGAMALSEDALDAELADSDVEPVKGPAAAVDFFVND